ncbi:MAG: hypothetical protein HPY53_01395 [Brevinematales bacterium]|nr:hypothetical protein [Brevinematales bacterium]
MSEFDIAAYWCPKCDTLDYDLEEEKEPEDGYKCTVCGEKLIGVSRYDLMGEGSL